MSESEITDQDVYLFNEGRHFELPRKLGAHPEAGGTRFAVWAPTAEYVSVIGDFNGWDGARHPLRPHGSSGIWEARVPGIGPGDRYKYRITGHGGTAVPDKADPFARAAETPPYTASLVTADDRYAWGDAEWMAGRAGRNARGAPWSIYELHVGSWARAADDGDRSLGYRELAQRLG
ncbi:MAG: 1,4-alpha-glucan branching enzyme, partial [Candidatus Dormibacteraceae bacterium]